MYLLFPSLRLRVHLFAFPALLLLLWIEGTAAACILLSAALLHEAGHFLALARLGVPVRRVDLEPMGATIAYDEGRCGLRESVLISLAGAGANLLFALLSLPFVFFLSAEKAVYPLFFCLCNVFLAILNLLPLESLDGGSFLRSCLLYRLSPQKTETVCRTVSFVFTLLLTLALLLIGLKSAFPLWTLLLSAVFLSRL